MFVIFIVCMLSFVVHVVPSNITTKFAPVFWLTPSGTIIVLVVVVMDHSITTS
jgi:hypothetical protein